MNAASSPSRRATIANLIFVLSGGLLIEFARSGRAPAPWPYIVEFVATIAVIAAWGWRSHRRPHGSQSATALRDTWWACGLALTPVVWEMIGRCSGRFGQSPEFLLFAIVRNMAFVLAVSPRRPGPWSLSSPLTLFLALGSLPALEGVDGWGLAALFVGAGVLRLASGGWERLQGKFACHSATEAPRTAILAVTVGGLALACLFVGRLTGAGATTAFFGIFPSAGGERWHDAFASGGVRDGDQLVGARDEANGFGPVESELFLESQQPSLYDIANDMYGPPHRTKQQERVVALSSDVRMQFDHRKKSQTQQAGREFSTVRRRGSRPASPATRLSDALLFVGGRTPLHLRSETFDRFDGREWSRSDQDEPTPGLKMRTIAGRPWLEVLGGPTPEGAGPPERHLLKVIRLNSARIPTPVLPLGVHIDRIADVSFFGWTPDGALCLPGRSQIPPLQVLHLESCAPDRAQAFVGAADVLPQLAEKYGDSAANSRDERIAALAREWTQGLPRGWAQVAAVERRLREEFVLDVEARASQVAEHSVHEFLFETRRGPDYLFASSAVLMLRALGYPTRFVMGMYAAPERYDRSARLTPVLPQDLHAWAEISVAPNVWVTIEPSPGYEVLGPHRSWWRRGVEFVRSALVACAESPLRTGAALALLALAFVARRRLTDRALGWAWRAATWFAPGRRLSLTLWLLERRAALAGQARPATATLRRHYDRWCDAPTPHARMLREFLNHATRSLYSTRACSSADAPEIRQACEAVARRWTCGLLIATAPAAAHQAEPAPAASPLRVSPLHTSAVHTERSASGDAPARPSMARRPAPRPLST